MLSEIYLNEKQALNRIMVFGGMNNDYGIFWRQFIRTENGEMVSVRSQLVLSEKQAVELSNALNHIIERMNGDEIEAGKTYSLDLDTAGFAQV